MDCTEAKSHMDIKEQNNCQEISKSSSNIEVYSCDLCRYMTANAGRLKKHKLKHTQKQSKPFSCDQCNFSCRVSSCLKKHTRLRHPSSYKSALLGSLKRHKIIHSGEKPYSCDKCNYKCSLLNTLKRHKRTHTGEKPYACNQCSFKCNHSGTLKKHKQTHTREKLQTRILRVNKSTHSSKKPIASEKNTEPREVESVDSLESGNKPFASDHICGLAGSLKSDKFTHPDGDQVISNSVNDLKQHKVLHYDGNLFACYQCDYKCRKLSALRIHQTVHKCENPFECPHCSYICSLMYHQEENFGVNIKKDSGNLMTDLDVKMTAQDLLQEPLKADENIVNVSPISPENDMETESANQDQKEENFGVHIKKDSGNLMIDLDVSLTAQDLLHTPSEDELAGDTSHLEDPTFKPEIDADTNSKCDIVLSDEIVHSQQSGVKAYIKPVFQDCVLDESEIKINTLTTESKPLEIESEKSNRSEEGAVKDKYACDECDFRSFLPGSLKCHKMLHTLEQSFTCDLCSYKSCRYTSLRRHLRTHTGEKPYACEQCDFKCSILNNLRRHKLIHSGEKPYRCDQCSFRCRQWGVLKNHKIRHTGQSRKVQVNPELNGDKSVSIYPGSMKTNTGEKPFACDLCDHRCYQAAALKSHMLTHTGEKPFLCDVCGFSCTLSGTLNRHRLKHTGGGKQFSCDQCSYTSNLINNLKQHKARHSGEKPHSCDICDYKCTDLQTLNNHKLVHTSKRPFKCDQCSYAGKQMRYLKNHSRRHNPNRGSTVKRQRDN